MTPVIFRQFPNGEIIALFPAMAGDNNPYKTCGSYMHDGQHGSASADFMLYTRPAKPEQYADLLAELRRIGYDDLKIMKRVQYSHFKTRLEECK